MTLHAQYFDCKAIGLRSRMCQEVYLMAKIISAENSGWISPTTLLDRAKAACTSTSERGFLSMTLLQNSPGKRVDCIRVAPRIACTPGLSCHLAHTASMQLNWAHPRSQHHVAYQRGRYDVALGIIKIRSRLAVDRMLPTTVCAKRDCGATTRECNHIAWERRNKQEGKNSISAACLERQHCGPLRSLTDDLARRPSRRG